MQSCQNGGLRGEQIIMQLALLGCECDRDGLRFPHRELANIPSTCPVDHAGERVQLLQLINAGNAFCRRQCGPTQCLLHALEAGVMPENPFTPRRTGRIGKRRERFFSPVWPLSPDQIDRPVNVWIWCCHGLEGGQVTNQIWAEQIEQNK